MEKSNNFIGDVGLSESTSFTHFLDGDDDTEITSLDFIKHSPYYFKHYYLNIRFGKGKLVIMSLNCQSSNSKFEEFRLFIDRISKVEDIGVVCLQDCINCTDYCCTDYSQDASIQLFHDYLIESCLEASKVIPVAKKHKIIPGWNEHVEQHKQTSQFWHFIWKKSGSPRNGEVAKIMRSTRSRYHYAIRYVKTNDEIMRKNAMASSISENNYRDLWKEVSKVRTKCKVTPQCMDDVTGSENIAELFANKYDMLYNSLCSNSAEIHHLLETNKDDIESLCLHLDRDPHTLINKHTHSITVIHVQEAIHRLKSAKSDCTDQLFSDHFINGTDRFLR